MSSAQQEANEQVAVEQIEVTLKEHDQIDQNEEVKTNVYEPQTQSKLFDTYDP